VAIKKWTIQRNWQHRAQKTKKNKTKTQHNMCGIPVNKTTGSKDEPNIIYFLRRKPLTCTVENNSTSS